MNHSDIELMAQGFPPSSIGKDHEEVVTFLATSLLAAQQKLGAMAAENALIQGEPSLASMMEALDIYYEDEDVPERAMLAAHRALLPKRSPVTDAYLNPVRAEGIIMFASKQLAAAGDLDRTITLERLMLNAEECAWQLRASFDKDDE
ncbi:hypothetical protein [Pantoea septica]|uniref:hypothetical protein n=1 Tax=Pantoea septica TaxID=472695 RepID=UPI0028A18537|nr:hypothetical protein [Pantoea septica]